MDDKKNFSLLRQYEEHLKSLQTQPMATDYEAKSPDKARALSHLLTMLPKMRDFIREGRREKFFRWLGFMQGVLWSMGEFSLNELRQHNRPSK